MKPIYLDYNSTTPLVPEVARAIADCYAAGYANPASGHWAGRRARRVLKNAREQIAQLLGADTTSSQADQVIFTSGGTEANNLAIRGLAGGDKINDPGHGIISAIEHPSISGVAENLERLGWRIDQLGVTRDGVVRVDQLAKLLTKETRFVSVMLGNNETGVLQRVGELAEQCATVNVPLHTDAIQVAGKLPIDFQSLGVAALSLSAHKFHGPCGIGALVVRHGIQLQPILYGGFQQSGIRPGTESVALTVGMLKALQLWQTEKDTRTARWTELQNSLETGLKAGWPDVVINGAGAPRLAQTSNVSFPGLDRQALIMALDVAGIACSTGSACASGSSEPSPVLLAMGCNEAIVAGSLRFSLGVGTTPQEVSEAVHRILVVCRNLQRQKEASKMLSTPRVERGQTV